MIELVVVAAGDWSATSVPSQARWRLPVSRDASIYEIEDQIAEEARLGPGARAGLFSESGEVLGLPTATVDQLGLMSGDILTLAPASQVWSHQFEGALHAPLARDADWVVREVVRTLGLQPPDAYGRPARFALKDDHWIVPADTTLNEVDPHAVLTLVSLSTWYRDTRASRSELDEPGDGTIDLTICGGESLSPMVLSVPRSATIGAFTDELMAFVANYDVGLFSESGGVLGPNDMTLSQAELTDGDTVTLRAATWARTAGAGGPPERKVAVPRDRTAYELVHELARALDTPDVGPDGAPRVLHLRAEDCRELEAGIPPMSTIAAAGIHPGQDVDVFSVIVPPDGRTVITLGDGHLGYVMLVVPVDATIEAVASEAARFVGVHALGESHPDQAYSFDDLDGADTLRSAGVEWGRECWLDESSGDADEGLPFPVSFACDPRSVSLVHDSAVRMTLTLGADVTVRRLLAILATRFDGVDIDLSNDTVLHGPELRPLSHDDSLAQAGVLDGDTLSLFRPVSTSDRSRVCVNLVSQAGDSLGSATLPLDVPVDQLLAELSSQVGDVLPRRLEPDIGGPQYGLSHEQSDEFLAGADTLSRAQVVSGDTLRVVTFFAC